nr:nitroreductase family protein [uncultured Holophaga sp.]
MPRPSTFQFHIDPELCTRCGLCVSDCPVRIISQEQKGIPFVEGPKESRCIHCQHCLAVCPVAALSIDGLQPADSQPTTGLPSFEAMDHLVRSRRSIRHYRRENVDPALLSRILASLAHVPTGTNAQQLTFRLIDDLGVMERFRQQTIEALIRADAAGDIPDRYVVLRNAHQAFTKYGIDILFRGAPHLLVVSAPPHVSTPQQDVDLALATFELLAQSAGLGTVWSGFACYALETAPELKTLLGLPRDHAYYAMPFGLPAVRHPRTVQREHSAEIHRVVLS